MHRTDSRKILPLILLSSLVGCVSWFAHGGTIVDAGYQAQILVNYDAQGTLPPNTTYHLVRTEAGEAIFERSADGSGALVQTHWKKDGMDHYSMRVRRSHAYEYVIPEDRTKPGKKFVYPAGTYEVKTIDGVQRAVPTTQVEPVATLVPKT